jgi:hypothetical protein
MASGRDKIEVHFEPEVKRALLSIARDLHKWVTPSITMNYSNVGQPGEIPQESTDELNSLEEAIVFQVIGDGKDRLYEAGFKIVRDYDRRSREEDAQRG